MVMPITSTKNFRLSSGFGVSSSMWPRWARSKIGSGVMDLLPLFTQRLPSDVFGAIDVDQSGLGQRFAHIVEIQTQHAGGKLRALGRLVVDARLRLAGDVAGLRQRYADDAVVIRHDDVARRQRQS